MPLTAEERKGAPAELGGGARFWTYISPQNDTAKLVTWWQVTLTQGNWTGEMSSGTSQFLDTPGLSGEFDVVVEAIVGPNQERQRLEPQDGSKPNIGCNDNCASMIGIVADPDNPSRAYYWTTWDAICS